MKAKNLSLYHLLIPCLFSFILLLNACKRNDSRETEPSSNNPEVLLSKLKEYGFTEKDILDQGEYFLVEGDLLFHKEKTDIPYLDRYFSRKKSKERDLKNFDLFGRKFSIHDQAHSQYLVSASNVEAININVETSGLAADWSTAIHEALGHWANLSGVKINFYYKNFGQVPADVDISFRQDFGALPSNVIAAAEFPTSAGDAGFQVRINPDFLGMSSVPYSTKVYNMVHEIGHCIGLWHTNQSGGNQIPGTPASDPNSVMNGGTALYTWAGFSSYDIIAAQYLYPWSNPTDQWITSPDRKFPLNYVVVEEDDLVLTWNKDLHATATITVRIYKNNVLAGTLFSSIPNTGSVIVPRSQLFLYNTPNVLHHNGYYRIEIISDANPLMKDITSNFSIIFST